MRELDGASQQHVAPADYSRQQPVSNRKFLYFSQSPGFFILNPQLKKTILSSDNPGGGNMRARRHTAMDRTSCRVEAALFVLLLLLLLLLPG